MVIDYLRKSWESYKVNWMSFIIAQLIVLLIVGVLSLIGVGIIISSAELSGLSLLSPRELVSRILPLVSLIIGVSIGSIFFLLAGIIWSYLKIGLFGMASEGLRGKTRVNTMFRYTKKLGLRGLAASFVIMGVGIILLIIFVLGIGLILQAVGAIIGIIISSLIMMLFVLTFPGIVVDQLGVIKSIRTSVSVVKENYLELLALLLLYGIISLILSIIPVLGTLIVIFVISPMVWMSLIFFYKINRW
jgi:hypothetical protein